MWKNQNQENIRFPAENHENPENPIIPCENNENHEKQKIRFENHESYENHRIASEKQHNHESHRIQFWELLKIIDTVKPDLIHIHGINFKLIVFNYFILFRGFFLFII